jgi:imidazolonepropionase-like amidohydrolase
MRIADCGLRISKRNGQRTTDNGQRANHFRFSILRLSFLLLCFVVLLPFVHGQMNSATQQNVTGKAGTFIIKGAKIIPVVGAEIESGSVLIRNGKIEAVGATVNAPGDATVIEGRGLRVYPGMIDAATNMGLIEIPQGAAGTVDINETGGINPNAKSIVAVHPHSAHINVTRVNGITTVLSMPGGGVVSGQAAIINLNGSTPYEMAVNESFALVINFPRVSTFGGFGGFAQVQTPIAELIRNRDRAVDDLKQWFRDAEAYGKAMEAAMKDTKLSRPKTNLKLAAMLPFIRGMRPIILVADREVDIRAAMKFADDMKIKMILMSGNDAWKVTKELKEKNIPVIVTGVYDLPVREDDPYDIHYENASKLQKAGVQFCIASGDFGAEARDLPYKAGMAASFGLPPVEALKAVTIYPAQILGVADKMGSIEQGKVANIVVTDGDILEARTNIKYLFIGGRQLPLTSRHTELYEQFKDRIR